MVDHTFVYTGAVRTIRGLDRSRGELGDLLYLDSVRVNLGLFQQDSNVIWDLAAHDLVDHGLPDRRAPVAVSADGTARRRLRSREHRLHHRAFRHGLPRALSRQLARAGEDPADAHRRQPAHARLRRHGSQREGAGVRQGRGSRRRRTTRRARQILVSYRTGDMYAPKLDRREALAAAWRGSSPTPSTRTATPLTGAAAGIRVVSLLEAAEQSLRAEGLADPPVKFQSIARREARQDVDLRLRQSLRLRDRRRIGSARSSRSRRARIGAVRSRATRSSARACDRGHVFVGHGVTSSTTFPRGDRDGELQTPRLEVVPTVVARRVDRIGPTILCGVEIGETRSSARAASSRDVGGTIVAGNPAASARSRGG